MVIKRPSLNEQLHCAVVARSSLKHANNMPIPLSLFVTRSNILSLYSSISDNPVPSLRDQAGFGVSLIALAERPLLNWISVNRYLSIFCLYGSERVNASLLSCHCWFIISLHTLIDCSSSEKKSEFCWDLSRLLRSVFNRHFGCCWWFYFPTWLHIKHRTAYQRLVYCPHR